MNSIHNVSSIIFNRALVNSNRCRCYFDSSFVRMCVFFFSNHFINYLLPNFEVNVYVIKENHKQTLKSNEIEANVYRTQNEYKTTRCVL